MRFEIKIQSKSRLHTAAHVNIHVNSFKVRNKTEGAHKEHLKTLVRYKLFCLKPRLRSRKALCTLTGSWFHWRELLLPVWFSEEDKDQRC